MTSRARRPQQSAQAQPNPDVCAGNGSYTVQQGDTMWGISQQATGSGADWGDIHGSNPQLEDPNLILPGQVLDVSRVCDEEAPGSESETGQEVGGTGITASEGGSDGGSGPTDSGGSGSVTLSEHEAPAEVSPTAPGSTFGTGNDAVDRQLDAESADNTHDLQCRSTDWIDSLNGFRDNPFGGAAINTVERLIPIYGFYDAFRDSWNTAADQLEVMPDDAFLATIVVLEGIVSTLSGWVSHLNYLVSAFSWATAALEGLGIAVNASLGQTLNQVTLGLDLINLVLGIIGTAYSMYQADNESLSEADRARYRYLAFTQADHTVGSLVSVAFDCFSLASVNFVPKQVLETIGSQAGKEIVKAGIGGLISGEVGAGYKALLGGAAPERPEPKAEYFHFPRDIIGDLSLLSYPFVSDSTFDRLYSGATSSSGDTTCESAPILESANQRAASEAPGAAAAPALPATDHSPSQVERLATLEAGLQTAVATTDENIGTFAGLEEENEQVVAGLANAGAEVGRYISTGDDLSASLTGAMPGLTAAIGANAQVLGQAGGIEGGTQQAMGALQSMLGLGNTNVPDAPPQEDRSLLQRAGDWLYDNTIGRAVSAMRGALSGVIEQAMGGQGMISDGPNTAPAGVAQIHAQGDHLGEVQAGAQEAKTGTDAQVATYEGYATDAQSKQVEAEAHGAELAEQHAEQDSNRDEYQALLDEVRAEKERQIAANAAYAAQYGPLLASSDAGSEGLALQEAHGSGLYQALDVVHGVFDAILADATGQAGGLSGPRSVAAREAIEGFEAHVSTRLGEVTGAVGRAAGLVGQAGESAWAALSEAQQALQGAEMEIKNAGAELMGVIGALATLPFEEEGAAPGPEQSSEAA